MKYLLLLPLCFFMFNCKTTKEEVIVPPSISTGVLKESLIDTKTDLLEAGELNNNISLQLDKAYTLAEQIDIILEKIEREQEKLKQKTVIPFDKL